MDNLRYNEPGVGPPVSTDYVSITGVLQHIQRMKLGLGGKDNYQGDLVFGQAAATGSLPVVLASDQPALPVTQQGSWVVGVTGSLAVTAPTVVGISGVPTVSVNNFPSPTTIVGISGVPTVNQGTSPWVVVGAVTASQSGNWMVGISGTPTVSVSNLPSATTVVGISGIPTVTVSNPTAVVGISGTPTVSVSNFPTEPTVVGISGQPTVAINGTVLVAQAGAWAVSLSGGSITAVVDSVNVTGGIVGISGQPTVAINGTVDTLAAQSGPWAVAITGDSVQAVEVVGISGVPTIQGTVTANQGGDWVVGLSGTPSVSVSNFPTEPTVVGISGQPTVAINGTVNVNATQAGAWAVAVSGGTITAIVDSVNVTGGLIGVTGVPTVSVSNFPSTTTLANPTTVVGVSGVPTIQGTVTANQGGNWMVGLSGSPVVSSAQSGAWSVTLAGGLVGVTGIPTVSVSNTVTVQGTVTATANQGTGGWVVGISGVPTVQLTGTSNVSATQSGGWIVAVTGSLPAGTNAIGIVDTELPAAATLADATTNPTVPLIGAAVEVFNGLTWDRWKGVVGISGVPTVQVSAANPVPVSGVLNSNQVVNTFSNRSELIHISGVQLASASAYKGVEIKSSDANTGYVYVGNASGVTAGTSYANDGFELGAGESMLFPVDNANRLWLIASASGHKIYMASF